MINNYSIKNRIYAFLYIEDMFYVNHLHTECISDYLISKNLIDNNDNLYEIIKEKSKQGHILRAALKEVDYFSLCGELYMDNGERKAIIFKHLTASGIDSIKKSCKKEFGDIDIYMALYIGENKQKFNFVKI